jgi:cell division transport system permease protein
MNSVQKSQQKVSYMLAHWRAHHAREVKDSFRRMVASPLSSLLTLLVVALALALPTSLYLLLGNAEQLTAQWEGQARLSLYLQEGLGATQQSALHKQLAARADIAEARLITPAEALDEFRTLSGYGEVLDLLESNPLPAVIVITPSDVTPTAVTHLRDELAKLPEVASADIDLAWVQRLAALLDLGRHLMLALALALSATVLLVIGNTIRLGFESRRDEVLVLKLLGATDAFVRRPFLYTGFWIGLLGGLLACLGVLVFFAWMTPPAVELAKLYGSPFQLSGLDIGTAFKLLLTSTLLGISGAWLAVTRLLRVMAP